MKNRNISPELKELINSKSKLCISMIIPLNNIPSFKKINSIVTDHAIEKLEDLLNQGYEASLVNQFISKLKNFEDNIKNINGVKGIGIFISSEIFRIVTFPFEVIEKIFAGESFEIRDVL